ncbi:MAG TPA: HAMP domain-containing sensor histidine kinase, partial [Longimicrobiaceae bacterium]|nr:HAMP domain-containing sensor histidine kinase [Longimicrobiaceae bacterium]
VIGTDTPELVEAGEVLKRVAQAELGALLESLGADSVLTVPMTARGRTQGAVTFVCDGCRRYDAADLLLAEDLGRRCGMAVDNATLYAQAKEAARAAIAARNVTMLTARRAEDLLDEANLARHEAECAHEAKATFLGTVSHEFRTPLTAVQGFADLLSDEASGPINEAQRHQVERIRSASDHLLGLIDEILQFATQQAGRSEPRLRGVDVAEIVSDAASMVEPLATAKGVGFTVDVPTGPLLFRTDPGKFRHMVLNLAANAVKYTDEGAVRVTLEAPRGAVLLRVADTGIGIAPEHAEQAFTPFWQADASGGRGGGMGLGLAVTRQLAALLEGELTLEAGTGGGSVFSLRLPALPAEVPAQPSGETVDEAEQEHRTQGRRGVTRRGARPAADEETA